MGFYGYEPFDKAEATYVWTGLKEPGFFSVVVWGEAPNYTYGIELVRDPQWVGGLKINVMGWTGPLGEGKTPYKVHRGFEGEYLDAIVVEGSNGKRVIEVKQIGHEQSEEYMKSLASTA
jgi:hypothetical protein